MQCSTTNAMLVLISPSRLLILHNVILVHVPLVGCGLPIKEVSANHYQFVQYEA
jgi:hypothetical protein